MNGNIIDNRKSKAGQEFDFRGRLTRQRKEKIITIDDREDLDRLTQLLLNGMGYATVTERIPLGDYRWNSKLGLVIVERKTPADARDLSRLSSQLGRLRKAVEGGAFPILLIDHRKEYKRPGYEPWGDIDFDNLLVSCQGTVRVAHCLQGMLAHRLDALYKWSMKTNHSFLE